MSKLSSRAERMLLCSPWGNAAAKLFANHNTCYVLQESTIDDSFAVLCNSVLVPHGNIFGEI